MKSAILVTGHYWGSKRRAGFHWLADALVRLGWNVFFVTTTISWLSILRRDHRLHYPVRSEAGKIIQKGEHLFSYVWMTPWHPVNLRWPVLNRLTYTSFSQYGDLPLGELEKPAAAADLIILESTAGLMLYDALRQLNTRGRFVYRVSDDLTSLQCHPAVRDYESRIFSGFDLISVPSAYIARRFEQHPNVRLQCHGIDKAAFDAPSASPYGSECTRAIFVGVAHLDLAFLCCASRLRPEWRFHLIGPVAAPRGCRNIVAHGEMQFSDTVRYIKHANIGLQSLRYRAGAESFSDSLKVIQYTYCRLPIIAPQFMVSQRSHFIHYTPGDANSIDASLTAAEHYDRSSIDVANISTWDEVARDLVG